MNVTELDEVQALLEKVLPDPAGFAQRLLLQALGRWGPPVAGGGSPFTAPFHAPPSYTTATAEDITDTVAATVDWASSYSAPVDMNILLSAALGACECWGMRPGCELCGGHGCAGWTEPDPELFDEFVRPATAAMNGFPADAAESGSSTNHEGEDR